MLDSISFDVEESAVVSQGGRELLATRLELPTTTDANRNGNDRFSAIREIFVVSQSLKETLPAVASNLPTLSPTQYQSFTLPTSSVALVSDSHTIAHHATRSLLHRTIVPLLLFSILQVDGQEFTTAPIRPQGAAVWC